MANIEEVEQALEILLSGGLSKSDITILHCNTEYPTPFSDVNLKAMLTIRDKFGVAVGYSDHTLGTIVPTAAVSMGATVIEKHFTLDKNMEGPDHKASLEPQELIEMVQQIRDVEKILGDGQKVPSASEKKNISIARKSIHLKNNVSKGSILKEDDLIMKRPGDGISPMLIDDVIGKSVNEDLTEDHKLTFENLD